MRAKAQTKFFDVALRITVSFGQAIVLMSFFTSGTKIAPGKLI